MIITVTNYCENIGKSTIVVFLSNYFLTTKKFKNIFIIDCGKHNTISSIFKKEEVNITSNIKVDVLTDANKNIVLNEIVLSNLQASEDLYIVDLKADFEKDFVKIIKWSNSIIVPFANYSNILDSTISMGKLSSSIDVCNVFFIENFFNKKSSTNGIQKKDLSNYGFLIDEAIPNITNFKTSFLNMNDQFRFRKVFDALSYSLFD